MAPIITGNAREGAAVRDLRRPRIHRPNVCNVRPVDRSRSCALGHQPFLLFSFFELDDAGEGQEVSDGELALMLDGGPEDALPATPGPGSAGRTPGPTRSGHVLEGLHRARPASHPRPGQAMRSSRWVAANCALVCRGAPTLVPRRLGFARATFTVNAVQNRAANTSRRHIPAEPACSPDTRSCVAGRAEPLGCYAGFTAAAERAHCSAACTRIRCGTPIATGRESCPSPPRPFRGASCLFGSGPPSRRSAPSPLLLSSLRSSPRLPHQRRPGAHPHSCSGKPPSRSRLLVRRGW